MKNMRYLIIFSLVFTILLVPQSSVYGGNPVAATEITQILNYGTLLDMLFKSGLQLAKQTAMARLMDEHSRSLNNSEWALAMKNLLALGKIVRQGQAIAYSASNISEIINQRFPNLNTHLQQTNDPNYFKRKYADWNDLNRNTISNVLRSANFQYKNFATETAQLKRLQMIGLTSKGRLRALQVGHHIASHQVSQLQSLKSLIMSQIQMQGTALMIAQDKVALDQATNQNLSKEYEKTIIDDGIGY